MIRGLGPTGYSPHGTDFTDYDRYPKNGPIPRSYRRLREEDDTIQPRRETVPTIGYHDSMVEFQDE